MTKIVLIAALVLSVAACTGSGGDTAYSGYGSGSGGEY